MGQQGEEQRFQIAEIIISELEHFDFRLILERVENILPWAYWGVVKSFQVTSQTFLLKRTANNSLNPTPR
jgi:hypothetical protein